MSTERETFDKTIVAATHAGCDARINTKSDIAWQSRFLALLPEIRRHAKLRFRHLSPELHEELVQETIARALVDYVRLRDRGKERVAYAGPLSTFAVAQVRGGRRVGNRMNGCDVSSEYCRRRRGVSLVSLNERDESSGEWREFLVEDRHSTPAEIACSRLDVSAWFATLSAHMKQIASDLANGQTTLATARKYGVSAGRISQIRRKLAESWAEFQREPATIIA